jgi:hypothetical protein
MILRSMFIISCVGFERLVCSFIYGTYTVMDKCVAFEVNYAEK